MVPEYPEATAVVCHDAGAANVVIAGLFKTRRKNWRVYMGGPAEKLWKTAFPEVSSCESLSSAMEGVDLLITGTGWASKIEHEARKLARSLGIRSVALIDHWVNYAERFIRDDETVWPDEFWVTDEYAMELAKKAFPKQTILQVPNYYVDTELVAIKNIRGATVPELLYVLEPARSTWGRSIQGEFQALDYFVNHLHNLDLPSEIIIRLRPHPSDKADKYNEWIEKYPGLRIELDESISIAESIGRSTWVAGCESFALILAILADRTVYCTLPPWAPECRLPHSELIHIAKPSNNS